MALIETTDEIFQDVNGHRVYLSEKLGDWGDPVDLLFCDRLDLLVAPSIDQAVFSYEFGSFLQRMNDNPGGQFPALDFYRKYVKLELLDAAGDVAYTWYGYFATDEQTVEGSNPVVGDDDEISYYPSGMQKATAYGLIYLLETTIIDSSRIEKRSEDPVADPSTESMTVGRGLTFNGTDGIQYAQRGNRSVLKAGDYDGYIFSDLPFGSSIWDAESAVRYLCEFHAPPTPSEIPAAKLELNTPTDALTWYDKTVRTDLRNVKEVIDDLIDRRRGVGYYCSGDETGDDFTIKINVFTFADQPVDLGSEKTLPANPNTATLNFERALDVTNVVLTNNLTQLVGSVIVYGAPITVVCTLKPGDEGLKPGWNDTEETDYLAGDSDADDYETLDKSTKEKRNQAARSREIFKDVFTRFVLDPAFTGKVDHLEAGEDEHYILPDLNSLLDLETTDVTKAFATTYETGGDVEAPRCWWRGKRFLPELPLRDDTSILSPVDSYQRPFVVFETVADAEPENRVYEFGHALAANADNEDEDRSRNWSVQLSMLDTEPGVRMQVVGGPPHFIAAGNWTSAAATNQSIDPDPDEAFQTGALDYDDDAKTHPTLWTVAIESDDRLVETYESPTLFNEKAGNPDLLFAWERRKVIEVPDARLTLIAPGTVTDLTAGGQLVIDTKGSIYEDDRDRLRQIAEAAGIWYGTQRQALTMTYEQLNFLDLDLGHLITSIGENYSAQDVNSVLTGIRLDFLNTTTTLETSYTELDFV